MKNKTKNTIREIGKKPPAIWRHNKRQKQYKYFINGNDCSRNYTTGKSKRNRKHFHNPLDLGKYHLTARICLMAYFSPSYLTDPSNGNHYLLSFFFISFYFYYLDYLFFWRALIFFLLPFVRIAFLQSFNWFRRAKVVKLKHVFEIFRNNTFSRFYWILAKLIYLV